jgi:hypothetical protein
MDTENKATGVWIAKVMNSLLPIPPPIFLWYSCLLYASFLLDLLLYPEDKGGMLSKTSINF